MDKTAITSQLSTVLSSKRLLHSLGVARTAVYLAELYGVDPQQAEIAGLLHDCAREMSYAELLRQAEVQHLPLDALDRQAPVLLHARLGAHIARTEYGITDEAILQAITCHTVGGPQMTTLDKIIFLADYIEPGRDFDGVEALRAVAAQNLDQAVLAAYDQTIAYMRQKKIVIHPDTLAGRQAMVASSQKSGES